MAVAEHISRRARRSRTKGAEGEREVVQLHKAMKVHAERVPLSGAMATRDDRGEVDEYDRAMSEAQLLH